MALSTVLSTVLALSVMVVGSGLSPRSPRFLGSSAGRAIPLAVPLVALGFRPSRRALRFQTKLLPIVARLKLFELRRFESDAERAAALAALDARLAARARRAVEEMRGSYVKAAQLLTTLEPAACRSKSCFWA